MTVCTGHMRCPHSLPLSPVAGAGGRDVWSSPYLAALMVYSELSKDSGTQTSQVV